VDESRSSSRGAWLLIGLIALVAAGKVVLADTMDPDAFWHLRVADQMTRDGVGPLVDTLSFASDKTPWTPYSWLAELVMKWTWDAGGYRATILLTALCSATIVCMTALTCRVPRVGTPSRGWPSTYSDPEPSTARNTKPWHPADLTTVLATAIAAYFTLAFISFRPVTFALALLSIVIYLLYRDRAMRHRSRAVWIVPALVVLITNLHIYSAFALCLTMIVAIGSFSEERPQFKRMFLLSVLTFLAACCTPMLPGMIETSMRYNAVDPMVAATFIREMRPFYEGIGGKVSLAIVGLIVLFAIRNRRELRASDWMLLIFGFVVLARLGRFAPVFALIVMPIFARSLPPMKGTALRKKPIQIAIAAVLVIGLINIATQFPRSSMTFDAWLNRHTPDVPGYPTAAAAFVLAHVHAEHHRVFNEFDWGGYLAWRLGADWEVFLDGRTQLYPPDFWRRAFFQTKDDQRALLSSYVADAAIIPAKRSAFRDSLESLGWAVAYEDPIAVVMIKNE